MKINSVCNISKIVNNKFPNKTKEFIYVFINKEWKTPKHILREKEISTKFEKMSQIKPLFGGAIQAQIPANNCDIRWYFLIKKFVFKYYN